MAVAFGCWWAPVLLLALLLKVSGQTELRWRWLAAAAGAFVLYSLAKFATLPAGVDAMAAESRWSSRLAQLAVAVAMIALAWKRRPLLTPSGLGLKLAQAPRSLPWSLGGIVLVVLLGLAADMIDPAPPNPPDGWAGWIYQLTLPGLEEELMYRGLLLSLLAIALGGTGPAIGWAAVMATMIFAFAHGISPEAGTVRFNPAMIAFTALAGSILVAMRLKSGSLLLPMLGHNLLGLALRIA